MTPDQFWICIGAAWLMGVPVWRFTLDRDRLPLEGRDERWIRSAIWPVIVFFVVTMWLAFRGWPLLVIAAIVALLFFSTTGRLPNAQ